MDESGSGARGRRTPAQSRELVLDGARRALAEDGLAAMTVQGVMDRTPLGRSSFYVHFEDLEDVLAALVEANVALFLVPAAVWFDDPGRVTFQRSLARVVRTWEANRHWWGELIGASMAGRTALGQTWRRKEVDTWVRMVADHLPEHAPVLRHGIAPRDAARAFILMLFAVLVERSADDDVDLEALTASLIAAGMAMFYGAEAGGG